MSIFKEGQLVVIQMTTGNRNIHLRNCGATVVTVFRKNLGTKRKPLYKEFLYLDTTWIGLERQAGKDYVREIVLPASCVKVIPAGYERVTARSKIRDDDLYYEQGFFRAYSGFLRYITGGNRSRLFIRKSKKTVTKRKTK